MLTPHKKTIMVIVNIEKRNFNASMFILPFSFKTSGQPPILEAHEIMTV